MFALQSLHAATLAEPDRAFLARQAQSQGGLHSVMLTLENLSLEAIKARGVDAIRADVEQKAAALRARLGAQALEAGYWNNGLGQVGLLVTANGLRLLEQSDQVKTIQPDSTRGQRDKAWLLEEDRKAIESALDAKSTAEVELVLNSELGYRIEANGAASYQASPAQAAAQLRSLNELAASPAGRGLQIQDDALARAGASPVVRARIDRAAYFALRMAPQVRALRAVGTKYQTQWPDEVLEAAAKHGKAEVIISLKGADSYSPNQGYMSPQAWKSQSEANEAAIDELLASSGAPAGEGRKVYAGLGIVSVQLDASSLQALYSRKDARVRSIELNKPVANAFLHNSAPLVNASLAWNAGFRGAGQYVVVLDTGVRSSHLFFSNGANGSRIALEGCFGSNNFDTFGNQFKSICPSPDANGDSPLGLAGSGQPYQNTSFCSIYSGSCAHGTHVAGIASGRAHASLTPAGIQGMTPDSSIIAAQVFSFREDDAGSPRAFGADILAALNSAVANATPNSINPITINMSLGGDAFSTNCPTYFPSVTTAVANLNSLGVPVVVATGNDSNNTEIAWPACVPNAIKVSAVPNDGVGTTRAPYANIANPANFSDPILLAPGGNSSISIRSSAHLSDTSMGGLSGTSQAAPHVTGFYAAAKGVAIASGVADITGWLTSDGGSIPVAISGSWGTYNYRRIRASSL